MEIKKINKMAIEIIVIVIRDVFLKKCIFSVIILGIFKRGTRKKLNIKFYAHNNLNICLYIFSIICIKFFRKLI